METSEPRRARSTLQQGVPWPATHRSRLFDVLSSSSGLVVVSGGRFSGKSTLLRGWLAQRRVAGGVVGVVEPDPGLPGQAYWATVLAGLGSQRAPGPDALETLGSILDAPGAPRVLVLDDVHLLEDPEREIGALLRRGHRAGLRIIAATRTAGRWAEATELPADRVLLGPADLALTAQEIEVAAEAAGAGLARQFTTICYRETGGLTALVAATGGPGVGTHTPDEMSRRIREAVDRTIRGALTQDTALQARCPALLQLAVATPLTRAAAETVLSLPGGVGDPLALRQDATGAVAGGQVPAVVGELERLGMLYRDRHAVEPTWTIPEAVRVSLLRLAHTEDPDRLRATRLALAQHWLNVGHAHTAFVHAIAAAAWDLVLAILREHWRTLYSSDFVHMERDLASIPQSVLASEPLFETIRQIFQRFVAPKDAPTAPVEVHTADDTSPAADQMITAIALRIQGQFSQSAEECEPLLSLPEPDPVSSTQEQRDRFGFKTIHVGISLMMVGRFEDAIPVLRRGHHSSKGTYIERDTAGKLALAHAMLGHLPDAEHWIDEERRHPPLEPHIESVVRTAGMVAAALTALDRLRPNEALAVLTQLGPPDDREEFWGFILYVRALHALNSGTAADGVRFLDNHAQRFTSMCSHGAVVGPLLASVRADLLLALGTPDQAAKALGTEIRPLTAATRARLRLHRGDAFGVLQLWHDYATDLRCTVRDSIELDLAAAAASLQLGARDQARMHLARAVGRTHLTGLRRPFTTLEASTLHELSALGPQIPVATRAGAASPLPHPPLPHPPLTERELVILRSLEGGATTREIAAAHYVSMNTVKSQLRSIYRKLGTRTRQHTLDRARTLGLL